MDAKTLIEEIQKEKNTAIAAGVLRDEKPLAPITKGDTQRQLPEGWQWCRLGDYAMKVTDYVASGSFASLKENVLITNEEDYAVMVKTADFSNGFTKNLTYTDEKGYRFLENSNLDGGDLILSNIGSIGKVFIVPDLQRPMTLASNTVMIRMTHSEYNKYMYYMFISPFGQKLLMSISSGTSMLKFNKTELKSTIIPIAPLEIQNDICSILDSIQKIFLKRKTELIRLDDLIKARFVEMFGDPEENPNSWDKKPLSEVIVNANNGMARRGNDENGDIVMRLVELQDGYIDYSNPNRIILDDNEKKRYLLKDQDFLFARVNGNPDNVGRCAVFHEIGEPVYHNDHIIRVHFDGRLIDGTFASALFNSDYGKKQLKSKIKTSAGQYTVSQDGIGAILAILPPIENQTIFAEFVHQVNKSKSVIQKSLDETQLLFDSLMQQYFG